MTDENGTLFENTSFCGTWSHAVWFPCSFFVMGWMGHPLLLWISFGWFLHLIWDHLSDRGVCWFYPFEKYDYNRSRGLYKRSHRFYLYVRGQKSEVNFIIVVCLMASIGVFLGIRSCLIPTCLIF